MASSEADSFLKIGALFATYFVVETLGYSHGVDAKAATMDTVQSMRAGMDHLIHVLTPWSNVAWPVGPFLCAILLAYAPFLPKLLAQSEAQSIGAKTNRIALCMAVAVSTSSIIPALPGPETSARWVHDYGPGAQLPILLSLIYVGWLTLLATLAFRFLIPEKSFVLPKSLREEPWPEFFGAVFAGWLIFVAYLGSRFDGALDQFSSLH